MASRKGICSVCDENVTVRADGLVRAHGYLRNGEDTPKVWCAGSNQPPRQAADGSFSALCEHEGCTKPTHSIVWLKTRWISLCTRHGMNALRRQLR